MPKALFAYVAVHTGKLAIKSPLLPPALPQNSDTTQFRKVGCGTFTFMMTVILRSKYLLRKRYILYIGHL